MPPELVEQVRKMIAAGFGAHGITLESRATLKQANAVFELVRQEAKRAGK
jgi:hypothetical protein